MCLFPPIVGVSLCSPFNAGSDRDSAGQSNFSRLVIRMLWSNRIKTLFSEFSLSNLLTTTTTWTEQRELEPQTQTEAQPEPELELEIPWRFF